MNNWKKILFLCSLSSSFFGQAGTWNWGYDTSDDWNNNQAWEPQSVPGLMQPPSTVTIFPTDINGNGFTINLENINPGVYVDSLYFEYIPFQTITITGTSQSISDINLISFMTSDLNVDLTVNNIVWNSTQSGTIGASGSPPASNLLTITSNMDMSNQPMNSLLVDVILLGNTSNCPLWTVLEGSLQGSTQSFSGIDGIQLSQKASLTFSQNTSGTYSGSLQGDASESLSIINSNPSSPIEIIFTGTNTAFQGTTTIGTATTLYLNPPSSSTMSFTGSIYSTEGLFIDGAGTVILGDSNSQASGTTISQGTLQIPADSSLGPTGVALNMASGSTLQASQSFTMSRPISLTAGSDNAITIDTQNNMITLNSIISDGGANIGITKTGSGTLVLEPASDSGNQYGGPTTISEGTIQIFSYNNLGPGPVIFNGTSTNPAILEMSASEIIFPTGRSFQMQGEGTLSVPGANCYYQSSSSSPSITGSGLLTIAGGGTTSPSGSFTMVNPNNYSGGTTIGLGPNMGSATLFLGDNGATAGVGSGVFTIYSGSVFDTSAITSSTITIGDLGGGGTIHLGSNNLTTGTIPGSGISTTFSGSITGSGGGIFEKQGINTLILTPNNMQIASTYLLGGTLNISTDTILGPTGVALNMTSGSTLQAGQSFTMSRPIALSGTPGSFATIDTLNNVFTITSTISDGGANIGITKKGSGTLLLDPVGGNTYGGPTTISEGTLNISAEDDLGLVAAFNIAGGATLQTNQTLTLNRPITLIGTSGTAAGFDTQIFGAMTLNGTITDGGDNIGITKTGSGVLILEPMSPNTYGGPTTISDGSLQINSDSDLGTGSVIFNGTSSNSATLQIAPNQPITFGANRAFELDGNGTLYVQGTDSSQNASATAGFTGDGLLMITGNGTTSPVGSFTMTYANNNYSGGTTIGSAPNVGSATLFLTGAGSAGNGNGIFTIYSGSVFDTSAITSSTITIGDLTGGGNLYLGFETLITGTNSGASTTFSGSILGQGIFQKQGSNTLTLTGDNIQAGGTDLAGGTLNISADSNLGMAGAPFSMAGGATLQAEQTFTMNRSVTLSGTSGSAATFDTQNNTLTITGTINGGTNIGITKTGSGTLVLEPPSQNTYGGPTTILAGTLQINGTNALGTGPVIFNGTSTTTLAMISNTPIVFGSSQAFQLNGDGTLDVAGTHALQNTSPTAGFTGTGLLTILGGGTINPSGSFTMSYPNSYSGGTTIGSGPNTDSATLFLTGAGAAGNGNGIFTIYSGSVFDISEATFSSTIGDLSGNGTIYLGFQTLITGTNSGASTTFSGSMSGLGGIFQKQGSNTLTLTGDNTQTGGTNLAGGTLNISTDSNLGMTGAPFSMTGGATLQAEQTFTMNRLVTLSGTSGSSATFDTQSNMLTINDAISDGGANIGITKIGSGILTLTGVNTYYGTTDIQAGTLVLEASSNLTNSPAVNISSGATLQGVGTIFGSVNVNSNGTLYPGIPNEFPTGQLLIRSNLDLMPGALMTITVDSQSQNSSILFLGEATINGQLTANILPPFQGTPYGTNTYTIVETFGGILSGTFQNIVVESPSSSYSFIPSLTYPGSSVLLKLQITPIYSNFSGTERTSAVATTQHLLNSAQGIVYNNYTANLHVSQQQIVFNSASPARVAAGSWISNKGPSNVFNVVASHAGAARALGSIPSTTQMATTHARFNKNYLVANNSDPHFGKTPIEEENSQDETSQQEDASAPYGSTERAARQGENNSIWIEGFGDWAKQNAQNQIPTCRFLSAGALLGYDYFGWEHGLITAFAGYLGNKTTQEETLGHSTTNSIMGGSFVTGYIKNSYIEFGALFSFNNTQSNRHVIVPGLLDLHATASYHSYQLSPHLGLGTDLRFSWGFIEPYAFVDYIGTWMRGFQEHGAGLFDMSVKSHFSSFLRSELGLKFYQYFQKSWAIFILKEKLGYVNKAPFNTGRVTSAYVGETDTFVFDSFNKNQSLVIGGFEMLMKGTSGWFGSAQWDGEYGSGFISNQVIVKLGKYF